MLKQMLEETILEKHELMAQLESARAVIAALAEEVWLLEAEDSVIPIIDDGRMPEDLEVHVTVRNEEINVYAISSIPRQ